MFVIFNFLSYSISKDAYDISRDTALVESQTARLEQLEGYPALSVRCSPSLYGRPDYQFSFYSGHFSAVDGIDFPTHSDYATCSISNDGKLPALNAQIYLRVRTQPRLPQPAPKTIQEAHDLRAREAAESMGYGGLIQIPRVGASERLIFQLVNLLTDRVVTIGVLRDCQFEIPDEVPAGNSAAPVSTPRPMPCHLPRTDVSAPANQIQRDFQLRPG